MVVVVMPRSLAARIMRVLRRPVKTLTSVWSTMAVVEIPHSLAAPITKVLRRPVQTLMSVRLA